MCVCVCVCVCVYVTANHPSFLLTICPSIPPCSSQMTCHRKNDKNKKSSSWRDDPVKLLTFFFNFENLHRGV
jgi:hypothetical protein